MSSPLESDQLSGLGTLASVLRGLSESNDNDVNISWKTKVVVDILRAAREAQTDQIRALALECIALMSCKPAPNAQLVAAGAITFLVDLLRSREPALSPVETEYSVDAVESIAEQSHAHCDALRAAGALTALLPHVRANISAPLRDQLFPALACIMRGQPVAKMASAQCSRTQKRRRTFSASVSARSIML